MILSVFISRRTNPSISSTLEFNGLRALQSNPIPLEAVGGGINDFPEKGGLLASLVRDPN
jgi:hypothetical protein